MPSTRLHERSRSTPSKVAAPTDRKRIQTNVYADYNRDQIQLALPLYASENGRLDGVIVNRAMFHTDRRMHLHRGFSY